MLFATPALNVDEVTETLLYDITNSCQQLEEISRNRAWLLSLILKPTDVDVHLTYLKI